MSNGSRYQPKPFKHGDKDTCTCPHCWTVFPFGDVLFVARHPELVGDPHLGADVPSRFKPTRFTPEGRAIDPGGFPCLEMACPNCHLEVPSSLREFRSIFFSIVGTSESGKSFFLTSLIWSLRKMLSTYFAMSLTDLETTLNEILHQYEDTLFFAKDMDALVTLKKTELEGELYNRVDFDGTETLLPRPFLFNLQPQQHHPKAKNARGLSRTLVLYDNSGEHFNPNQDKALRPGTQHMAQSSCLFFLFDPAQDPRFREKLSGSSDPQLNANRPIRRQDICFNEAARRIRRHLNLLGATKCDKPIVVVVNKYDMWRQLLPMQLIPEPFVTDSKYLIRGLDTDHVEDVSFSVRWMLNEICPEVVTAVEELSDTVTYIPASAIGSAPILHNDGLHVRPRDMNPIWVAIPFLYAFAQLRLIYTGNRRTPHDIPAAKLVRQVGGLLVCEFPDGSRIQAPMRLAGRALHHPKTGVKFVVPMVPSVPVG